MSGKLKANKYYLLKHSFVFKQTEDVRSNLEILKNSYLAIVNSLVILNERKRKRGQQQSSTSSVNGGAEANRENSGQVGSTSSNFIDAKVAEKFRSSDQDHLTSYPDTYEWRIAKFCDPATRDAEFKRLFHDVRFDFTFFYY